MFVKILEPVRFLIKSFKNVSALKSSLFLLIAFVVLSIASFEKSLIVLSNFLKEVPVFLEDAFAFSISSGFIVSSAM